MKSNKSILSALFVAFATTSFFTPQVFAEPTVSIGHWDYQSQSVTYVYYNTESGTYNWGIEEFVKDTLPGEWYPSDPKYSLWSGSLLIRTGANYFYRSPEYGSVNNTSGRYFHFRDSRYLGWNPDSRYNASSASTNSATDITFGRVIYQNSTSRIYTPFNDCVQNATTSLANQGYTHTDILLSSSVGIYSASSKYGCLPTYEPYLPNLSFYTAYTY